MEVGDLPSELTQPPLVFVAFFGLEITRNPVHAAVWESFNTSSRRSEKSPLKFKYFPEDHVFPPKKAKKGSYEWYIPKGILKSSWLPKHLQQVPAVAVLFFDLDWDDPKWVERQAECVRCLYSLRESLKERNTKIALVLIQQNIPLPGGENVEATERAASLCSACDLSAKYLFALPHSDHLNGYTLRMEGAFLELAQNYYQLECKRIKYNRDGLNKTNHQLLFVRHQFKMAFLNELKQDFATAVKHYKQAYANLTEIRTSDAHSLEVKTVGGFINYKICSLSFNMNKPLDAISQFRKHVDIFRSKVGPPELAFEHSQWMAKQYSHFGNLFDEAVKQGLTAIQTQHPGFYHQQAANCAMLRRQQCAQLCQASSTAVNPELLTKLGMMEYFGQRPWRPGLQSFEPPDMQLEKEGIAALQAREAQANHSNIIISYLRNAVAQFRKYKCPRMKRLLTVQMGEEYYYTKEYNKALTVLSHVLWEYRLERWYPLVSSILLTALKCAFLSANLQEYITLGLEAVSTWVQCSVDDKSLIQSNVNTVLQGNAPLPLASLSQEEVNLAEAVWKETLSSKESPLIFTIPMSNVIPFVECKTSFGSKHFRADELVTLHVYLRINCPQPLKFSKLSVMFNNSVYNSQCEIPGAKPLLGENGSSLYVLPGKMRLFTFTFLPSPVDVNGTISVTSLALQLGSEKHNCAVLVWTEGSNESSIHALPRPDFQFVSSGTSSLTSNTHSSIFNKMPEELSTRIVPREPRLSVHTGHQPPVLLGELYPLQITITSEEVNSIQNVTFSLGLSPRSTTKGLSSHTCFVESLESSSESCQDLQSINLGNLNPGEMVDKWVFLKATSIGTRELLIQVSYMTEVDVEGQSLECHCIREEILNLSVEEPLKFTTRILNMKFQPVEFVRLEEPFLLSIEIQSCTPLPVVLNGGALSLASNFSSTDPELVSEILGLNLDEGESATECFPLITFVMSNEAVIVGNYTLTWRRESKELSLPWVQLEVPLPSLKVVKVNLFAEVDCPSHGWVRTPLSLTYKLHNRTSNVQEMVLMMDSSDAFMYAGNRKLHFWILPRSSHQMLFNLYPLVSGYVQLPKLKLTMNPGKSNSLSLDDLIHDMLPSHMFIMPQGKNVENRSLTNGRSP